EISIQVEMNDLVRVQLAEEDAAVRHRDNALSPVEACAEELDFCAGGDDTRNCACGQFLGRIGRWLSERCAREYACQQYLKKSVHLSLTDSDCLIPGMISCLRLLSFEN